MELASVAREVQESLRLLGFYRGEVTGVLDEATLKALEEWMAVNNFENKIRKDGKIWGTVYRFLVEEAGRRRG